MYTIGNIDDKRAKKHSKNIILEKRNYPTDCQLLNKNIEESSRLQKLIIKSRNTKKKIQNK